MTVWLIFTPNNDATNKIVNTPIGYNNTSVRAKKGSAMIFLLLLFFFSLPDHIKKKLTIETKKSTINIPNNRHKVNEITHSKRHNVMTCYDWKDKKLKNVEHQKQWKKRVAMYIKCISPFYLLISCLVCVCTKISVCQKPFFLRYY
jgi:hypothetical protein